MGAPGSFKHPALGFSSGQALSESDSGLTEQSLLGILSLPLPHSCCPSLKTNKKTQNDNFLHYFPNFSMFKILSATIRSSLIIKWEKITSCQERTLTHFRFPPFYNYTNGKKGSGISSQLAAFCENKFF